MQGIGFRVGTDKALYRIKACIEVIARMMGHVGTVIRMTGTTRRSHTTEGSVSAEKKGWSLSSYAKVIRDQLLLAVYT